MSKLRVAVLMGGPSSEREVSLRSGAMVLNNLDPSKYAPFALDLSELLEDPQGWLALKQKADFVFLALHGSPGEDGAVQGILELWGLPYYGSGVLASALALNKVRSKAVYRELGLVQARSLDFKRLGLDVWQRGLSPLFGSAPETLSTEALTQLLQATIGFEVLVKGASQGSTLGLENVHGRAEFWPAVERVLEVDPELLVEERVAGIEVTAGVIGGYELMALPLIEIRPKASPFFDYEAKYTPGASEEICPARINDALTAQIQALALRAHKGLGCWGVSRSDFIISGNEAYILETNTLPGLTENSLIPKAARQAGIMLPDLLDRFIEWGLLRQNESQAASKQIH